ncbi:MAG TPA: AAA family ATPase [Verrucomicrobiota bacterium]|nr:AAA family ATPase [Verrucomicrobiota bacterium]
MDLLSYWSLKERPFEATWDTRFFYQSKDHDEALNRLSFLVGEETMLLGMLTGEIGCGKTLTRAVFTERLERERFKVVTQENSGFTFNNLMDSVLQNLQNGHHKPVRTKFARCEQLRMEAARVREEHRHLVLIFDEAQEMPPATLNELKMLTNFNGGGKSYLTIILVGQPELRRHVESVPAINQRISLRFHLNSLDVAATGDYLRQRLLAAGHPTGELFEADAVQKTFDASQGVPRAVNRIAKLALEHAWLMGNATVSSESVGAVIRDLERQQQSA